MKGLLIFTVHVVAFLLGTAIALPLTYQQDAGPSDELREIQEDFLLKEIEL